jgi:hypothetical protein
MCFLIEFSDHCVEIVPTVEVGRLIGNSAKQKTIESMLSKSPRQNSSK